MIRAPGTILIHLYFKERLKRRRAGRFVEVGAGQGQISRILLSFGWRGAAFDLNAAALAEASIAAAGYVDSGVFTTHNRDWLVERDDQPVDLVVSCMVLEHMSDEDEGRYFQRCREVLSETGRAVLFVPGNPDAWGIEDETAGHLRRYSAESLRTRLEEHGWQLEHIAGLTFPVSNWLYPISEFLVRRAESRKLALSKKERTRQSGHRNIWLKTRFPSVLGLLLNDWVMYPFHLIQKMFRGSHRALVIYAECTPKK